MEFLQLLSVTKSVLTSIVRHEHYIVPTINIENILLRINVGHVNIVLTTKCQSMDSLASHVKHS